MSAMAEQEKQIDSHLTQHYKTLEARFDQAARSYDLLFGPATGSRPGNPLVTRLREMHVALLREVFPKNASLLDIGCGTGEEALALVRAKYGVLGIDISAKMIWQAQAKAAGHDIRRGLLFRQLPAGRLETLDERGPFQGAYASLGTLNTEPDLAGLARGLHQLLEPGAAFVATVMSRRCLFEILHNVLRLKPGRTLRRGGEWRESRAGTGGVEAPVKFYRPGEFAARFAPHFTVESVMAFPLWLPPVHMHELFSENRDRFLQREKRDQLMRSWPVFRGWGDHFLMILRHAVPEGDPVAGADAEEE
jgi:SAM-dependent methyltransferase